jgi:hypothetical protein
MKYLKTFENYSPVNEEEEGIRKFFTGHDSKDDRDEAMVSFRKALDDAEEAVNKNPKGYVFNRERLEKEASDNNYKGGLRIQRGGRDKSRMYVVYDEGTTGFVDVFVSPAAANRRASGFDRPGNS